jgi:hypothetical protein
MGSTTRLLTGGAGAVLVVSAFLPWAKASGGGDVTGWDLTAGGAALVLTAGLIAVAAAATGGTVGLFRPDVSLRAAADLFSVATAAVVIVVMLADVPEGADVAYGAVLALLGAVAVAGACGDYRVFRGAPLFPGLEVKDE